MPCGQSRDVFGELRQIIFPLLQDRRCIRRRHPRVFQPHFMPRTGFFKLGRFPFQPLDGLASVFVELAFAGDVVAQLLDAGFERFNRRNGPRLFIIQSIALDLKTLKHCTSDGFFFPQRWHGVITGLACCRCLPRSGLRLSRGGCARAQLLRCCGQGLICLAPAPIKEHPFRCTQSLPNFAIACGLPCLSRELRQLVRQLLDHIIHTGEVCLSPFELQLRLMPPLVEAGYTRRLFQDAPPRLWFGIDEFRNLTLPDKRWRMRTG